MMQKGKSYSYIFFFFFFALHQSTKAQDSTCFCDSVHPRCISQWMPCYGQGQKKKAFQTENPLYWVSGGDAEYTKKNSVNLYVDALLCPGPTGRTNKKACRTHAGIPIEAEKNRSSFHQSRQYLINEAPEFL